MPRTNLIDRVDYIEGAPPIDLAAGDVVGDWVNLAHLMKCGFLLHAGPGTATENPTLVIEQATDNTGAGAKALNPKTTRAWKKQAATNLAAVAGWSAAGGDLSGNVLTNADAGEQAFQWYVEVDESELDVQNAFTHVRATATDPGATAGKIGSLQYVVEPVYRTDPNDRIGAID